MREGSESAPLKHKEICSLARSAKTAQGGSFHQPQKVQTSALAAAVTESELSNLAAFIFYRPFASAPVRGDLKEVRRISRFAGFVPKDLKDI